MKSDLYIFGSAVRGEVERDSDIDVLAIVKTDAERQRLPDSWSVYSENTVRDYFLSGRLFAWHLHLESKCIFSERETPFLEALGEPSSYVKHGEDFSDLCKILYDSLNELKTDTNSPIFEIGVVYTAIRDIAMVASTILLEKPSFSRYSPYQLPIEFPISRLIYEQAIQARLLSTRNISADVAVADVRKSLIDAPIFEWINLIGRKL
ncbi:MAG TPA: nucleotidyltransferase domain-containing protein [Spongiibacteraceae bacterium]|nr:nucleotidyltransferase domain-containing protein [Spongiibacteraceae bacterium]